MFNIGKNKEVYVINIEFKKFMNQIKIYTKNKEYYNIILKFKLLKD